MVRVALDPVPLIIPTCENCGSPASHQCGICTELFVCSEEECFARVHRPKDVATHSESIVPMGAWGRCTHHGDVLQWMCVEPQCKSTLICDQCQHHGAHKGHKYAGIKLRANSQTGERLSAITTLRTALQQANDHLTALKTMDEEDSLLSRDTNFTLLTLQEAQHRCTEETQEQIDRQNLERGCDKLLLTTYVNEINTTISVLEDADNGQQTESLKRAADLSSNILTIREKVRLRMVNMDATLLSLSHPILIEEYSPEDVAAIVAAVTADSYPEDLPKLDSDISTDMHPTQILEITEEMILKGAHPSPHPLPITSEDYSRLAMSLPNRGTAFIEGSEFSKGQLFKRAITLDPEHSWAYHNLGDLLPKRGTTKLENGIAFTKEDLYKRAITLNPMDNIAYNKLAWLVPLEEETLMEDGSYLTKEQLFKRAIHIDPEDGWAFRALGDLMSDAEVTKLNNGSTATKSCLYKRAIALDRTDAASFHSLGRMLPQGGAATLEDGTIMTREQLLSVC